MSPVPIADKDQLLFAVFCIENVADALGISGSESYRALAERSGILNEYIVPCTDALHTQGKQYIVNDITSLMKKRGVIA